MIIMLVVVYESLFLYWFIADKKIFNTSTIVSSVLADMEKLLRCVQPIEESKTLH